MSYLFRPTSRVICVAFAILGQLAFHAVAAAETPGYSDQSTREAVEKMVAAHGGADRFFAAPSFRFSIAMYLYTLGINEERTSYDNWRYYTVTVDPDTSRAYVDVPHENLPGPEAGVTADEYWRTTYAFDPPFQEGPQTLAWFHYGILALPFLTQVEGVVLTSIEPGSLPNSAKVFPAIRMTFEPGGGKSMAGFIDLFIDPDTYLLAGWSQGSAFPLLPGDVLPPEVAATRNRMLRVVDAYHDIDGLIIPKGYYSNRPDGVLAGSHIILEASFDAPFDESQLMRPDGGRTVYERAE